jgi:hypothetical protein
LSNDRTQRDILKVAVEANAFYCHRSGKQITDDLLWLLKETEIVAEHRNIAIHRPLITLTDTKSGITTIAPQDFVGNRRAKSMRGKDILNELIWCRECAELLSSFAADWIRCMAALQPPWPERPELPNREGKNPHG